MLRCILAYLACVFPVVAAFQVSSASVAADGLTVTVTMNGTYTSGSTSSCYAVTGGNANSNVISTVTPTGGSASVVLAMAAPIYKTDTANVAIASAPTCLMTGSTGSAAASNANAANSSEWRAVADATMQASCRLGGFPNIGSHSNYPNSVLWQMPGASIDCAAATGSEIDIWALNYTSTWGVQQDGVTLPCPGNCVVHNGADTGPQNATATSGGGVWSEIVLATGLSGSHAYRIIPTFGQISTTEIVAIRFVGGDVSGTALSALPVGWECGDSISGVGGSGPTDELQYDLGILGYTAGTPLFSLQYSASSGALVSVALKDNCGLNVIPLGAGTPAFGMLQGGANDQNASTSQGTYTTAYETMICNALNYADCGDGSLNTRPPAKILVRGILPNTFANSPATYNTYAKNAIAAVKVLHPSAPITYYSTDGWINPSVSGCPSHDTADGVHPCGQFALGGVGFGKVANNEAPIFYALLNSTSSYTVSCGSTPRLHPTICTVSLLGGGTFYGRPVGTEALTFTPSDNGMICYAGVCTFGATTIPNPSSGTSYTFTYTPLTAGTMTLANSDNIDAWISPGNTSISVSTYTPTWTWQ